MKNDKTLIVATVAALVIGGIGGYTFGQSSERHNMHMNNSKDAEMQKQHNGMMGGMMDDAPSGDMMDHGMMMVSSEKEFITEMIPHHQEAVDTANEVLARGASTPIIKAFTEGIVRAQEEEIAQMKAWYEAWYGTPYEPSGDYMPMMRDLSALSGAELDKAFLEDMIPHHMGAIMMAHSVQGYSERPEIETFTKEIIDVQSKEIKTMRMLLQNL
jgi:uncharacterized protein (DUF305 family)